LVFQHLAMREGTVCPKSQPVFPALSIGISLPLEFPLEFLKLFQVGCRFPTAAGRAYDASGNTEHIRETGWEAL
ncbi:hypothetical protein, partial [Mesorhizobium sp. M2D.F.Ca.ET.140.01.1.1]|uniref:hypothetical protein n=1 Tax=Mesorhizobium sp. M2D.F.Ca.ET.140.01.1.1 TaxID=2496664 RepID=UPI001AEC7A15